MLDDDRLKQAKNFGQDYFDELLERIRSIRDSGICYSGYGMEIGLGS